jgi:hypothetical protein
VEGDQPFPDQLWALPMPADMAASAAVDVSHRGPFSPDGSLRGNIGGSALTLTLQLPWPTGSATGTLGDDPVSVAWVLHAADSGMSTLRGSVGRREVDVEGVFRREVDYQQGQPVLGPFTGASLQGTLAGNDLAATIETDRPDPIRGNSHKIVATGTLGSRAFEVFAGRGLRGTYGGQIVHLDISAGRVFGVCPGPPAFTALLVAALFFFH